LINPELRTEQREGIISDLVNIPFSYEKIAENNYKVYHKLVKGVELFDQFSQFYKKVYLIDQN
jgi:hypothetical protein